MISNGEAALSSLGKSHYVPGRLLAAPNHYKCISLFSLIQIFMIPSYLFSKWLIFFVWLVFLPKMFMVIPWLLFNPTDIHHLWCYQSVFVGWLVWGFLGASIFSNSFEYSTHIHCLHLHSYGMRYCHPGCITKGKPLRFLHKGVVLLVCMPPQHCYKSSLNSGCVQIPSVLVKYWGLMTKDAPDLCRQLKWQNDTIYPVFKLYMYAWVLFV